LLPLLLLATLFPYTTLFRSRRRSGELQILQYDRRHCGPARRNQTLMFPGPTLLAAATAIIERALNHALALDPAGQQALLDALERSEEHTSELQSRFDLVCRL